MLDLTLGLGGHAEAILARADAGTRYLGVDRDPRARERARARLGSRRPAQHHGRHLRGHLGRPGLPGLDARSRPRKGWTRLLMDLGVSSLQLKDPGPGLQLPGGRPPGHAHGPGIRDHRPGVAGRSRPTPPWPTPSTATARSGPRAPSPGPSCAPWTPGTLRTTLDLAAAVYTVLPREAARRKKQIDPATRTFQAIRIAVNGELARLARAVEPPPPASSPAGAWA